MISKTPWSVSALCIVLAWLAIAGSVLTGGVCGLFYGGIVLPVFLLVRRGLRFIRFREPLISLHAFVVAWIVTCLLFFLRKLVPDGKVAFDVAMLLGLAVLSLGILSEEKYTTSTFVSWLRLIFSGGYGFIFYFAILPVLFLLNRLGNEVVEGNEVAFYGQLYIDFGVLKGITNLLVASNFLPESFVYGTGQLSYHWLFFAVPAWNSDLFGRSHDMNGVLSIANYVAAIFLYRCLSHAISLAIRSRGVRHQGAWSDLGAAVVLFGMNVRYFHEAAESITNWPFLDLGERNRLLLSLPNSMVNFGNITFAISLLIVVLISLHRWNVLGNRWYLWLSCLWVGFMPMFSATTVPGIAIGIGIACLLNQVKSPWYSLSCFALIGLVCTLFFRYLGAFDSQSSAPRLTWDGGQFFKNCIFASPLLVLPFLIGDNFHPWSKLWGLGICVSIGLLVVPSFLTLGHTVTSSDLSMKNYAAVAAVLGIFVISTLVEMRARWATRTFEFLRYVVGFLIALGVINSSAYAMSSLMMRYPQTFGPIGKIRGASRTTLDGDYFQALKHINETYERSEVLLCESSPLFVDPEIIVAGNRAFLPNAISLQQSRGKVRDDLSGRESKWKEWKASGFSQKDLSRWFADRVDLLLVAQEIESADWSMESIHGKWRIYSAVKERDRISKIGFSRIDRQCANRSMDCYSVDSL
jgi:hypothetical protein